MQRMHNFLANESCADGDNFESPPLFAATVTVKYGFLDNEYLENIL